MCLAKTKESTLLGYLKDNTNMRIRSWSANDVSRVGKESLVKQVEQTLPFYAMSVFLLPLDITRNIGKALTRFWWNSSQAQASKINWMSWERLLKHKHAGGWDLGTFETLISRCLVSKLAVDFKPK